MKAIRFFCLALVVAITGALNFDFATAQPRGGGGVGGGGGFRGLGGGNSCIIGGFRGSGSGGSGLYRGNLYGSGANGYRNSNLFGGSSRNSGPNIFGGNRPQGPALAKSVIISRPMVKAQISGAREGTYKSQKTTREANPSPAPKLKSIKNGHLAGSQHPVTKVPFDKNGYPVFNSLADITLPSHLRSSTVRDTTQFKDATRQLWLKIKDQPALQRMFNAKQLAQIKAGNARIDKLTWHHHQDQETLQLVDRWTHDKTGHSGGRQLSGGRR